MGANSGDAVSDDGGADGVIPLERTLEGYLVLCRRRDGKRHRQNHPRHGQVDLGSRDGFHMRVHLLSGFSIRRRFESGSPSAGTNGNDRQKRPRFGIFSLPGRERAGHEWTLLKSRLY